MNAKPISEAGKSSWKETGCVVVFGLVFFSAGAAMLVFTLLLPWLSARAAQDWQEVPCTIIASEVEIHRGDDSTSYSVEAEFSYEFDQQKFISEKYDFNKVTRSRKECKEIVRQLPPGKEAVCFVDPGDPQNAVLNREFLMSWMTLIGGLIFSGFGAAMAIGLPILARGKNKRKKTVASPAELAAVQSLNPGEGPATGLYSEDLEDQKWDVPQRLKPSSTRVGTLVGMMALALFWNGIVGVLFGSALAGFKWNLFSIFLLLFSVPFVLVGLALIAGVVASFLSLFNPVFEIAISTGAITRGDPVDLAWEINGNAKRIKRLRIAVVGTESAQYRQGTSTRTDTSEFGLIPIADTTDTEEISFGNKTLTIPIDTMHTFADRHNEIQWAIHLRADIARFPDVYQKHIFRVKP